MKTSDLFDVLGAIVIVAGLFVLAGPQSQGPTLVNNLASGFTNSILAATGQG